MPLPAEQQCSSVSQSVPLSAPLCERRAAAYPLNTVELMERARSSPTTAVRLSKAASKLCFCFTLSALALQQGIRRQAWDVVGKQSLTGLLQGMRAAAGRMSRCTAALASSSCHARDSVSIKASTPRRARDRLQDATMQHVTVGRPAFSLAETC